MMQGKGILSFMSGITFEGDFANDTKNGYGFLINPNGQS